LSVLPVGFGSAAAGGGGYQIQRSLRFNSPDSAYLNRTLSVSSTSTTTFTWSGWVKRSALGAARAIVAYHGNTAGNGNMLDVEFASDALRLYFDGAGSTGMLTNAVYRDVSAWYHIVLSYDSTQATSTNRAKLYVNGTQITAFSSVSYPALNQAINAGNGNVQVIGSGVTAPINLFNGYMTEINFIDGQVPTTTTRTVNGVTETILTQLGEFNSSTGVWTPKAWGGTYGTNGFYVNFSDNSNNTAATLGKDYSGNGNNLTPNNFYVGPGTTPAEKAGIDSLVDSPTSYGTDTGVGGEVRGNYCTWNPLDNSLTLANGNLDTSRATASWASCRATVGMTSGKWYWEISGTGTYNSSNGPLIGISKASASLSTYPGGDANGWGYYSANGLKYTSTTGSSYGSTWTGTDVIGVAFDADNGTLTFYKNNTNQGTAFTGLTSGPYFPAMGIYGTATVYCNFGQRAFAYTAPSGFKALCTQNLSTPTIGATSTTQANDYMNVVLYTGNGSSQTVTGFGFNPDMVWHKGRSVAYSHSIVDAIRGNSNVIFTNTTDAEQNPGAQLALATDGATVTYRAANLANNQSSATYVIWGWNAGGSNATNTSGTITSTVRANTTSGFSIVTYTGNGSSGATVGHGCQVGGVATAPSFYVVKNRGSANKDWECYHISLGNTNRIRLNSTAAADTGGTMWANTSPTSTVFSVGSDADVNANTNTYVAYCFAPVPGYSAFGSYTGNGAADGPFVYLGFRPRYVMVKKTATGTGNGGWYIFDSARDPYNLTGQKLYANTAEAENGAAGETTTTNSIDILSNGFKLRTGNGATNDSQVFIYAAFAESPFKYALAR